jgi:hypothetical protein
MGGGVTTPTVPDTVLRRHHKSIHSGVTQMAVEQRKTQVGRVVVKLTLEGDAAQLQYVLNHPETMQEAAKAMGLWIVAGNKLSFVQEDYRYRTVLQNGERKVQVQGDGEVYDRPEEVTES